MKAELQWLQKMHFMVNIDGFDIEMDANPPFGESKHPQVFPEATFSFYAEGTLTPEKFNESIQLSLSKYCSVNAMVSKVVSIKWKSFIGGKPVGEGKAEFNF